MTEIQEDETNLFVATKDTVPGTLHRTPHGAYGEDTERVVGRPGVRGEHCRQSELRPQRLALPTRSFEEWPVC